MKTNLVEKVMKLLLLQEVHEKNQWSKELRLTEPKVELDTETRTDSPRVSLNPMS
jgi:hypothetical protein